MLSTVIVPLDGSERAQACSDVCISGLRHARLGSVATVVLTTGVAPVFLVSSEVRVQGRFPRHGCQLSGMTLA
jgi:hypothetical protein